MLFSEAVNITVCDTDTWFDPILSVDTKLFIDPFLLYEFEFDEFVGSHEEVVGFFNFAFQALAQHLATESVHQKSIAQNMLVFPEIDWLCLGYSASGTKGAGSGKGFAALIVDSILETIKLGKTSVEHFEEVSLLNEGFGADRISDTVANILIKRFCLYTKRICYEKGVPTRNIIIRNGWFSVEDKQWRPVEASLPENPLTGLPVLLVPKKYLRDLPTINTSDFWDYCWSNENETLRQQFGDDIKSRINKSEIIRFARRNTNIRNRYMEYTEEVGSKPYDFAKDKLGQVLWYGATKDYLAGKDLNLGFSNQDEFITAVLAIANEFKNFVENQGGWKLLWNDGGKEKAEEAAQKLFLGILTHYCKANNIDVSGEANIGRGPVDFKVSQGFKLRALFELKKANNTKFFNGIEKQLPTYLKAEGITHGFFMTFVFRDGEIKKTREIEEHVRTILSPHCIIIPITIDARKPDSASKL